MTKVFRGVAGGEKYKYKSIFFKFPVDSNNIYGGDFFANKTAEVIIFSSFSFLPFLPSPLFSSLFPFSLSHCPLPLLSFLPSLFPSFSNPLNFLHMNHALPSPLFIPLPPSPPFPPPSFLLPIYWIQMNIRTSQIYHPLSLSLSWVLVLFSVLSSLLFTSFLFPNVFRDFQSISLFPSRRFLYPLLYPLSAIYSHSPEFLLLPCMRYLLHK